VTAYAGHRRDERPSSIELEGRKLLLSEIRSLRIEEDLECRQRRRYFSALGSDGLRYVLCHEVAPDQWSVELSS
jgi:hypothetical protein